MVMLIKMDRYAAGLYIFGHFHQLPVPVVVTCDTCGRTGWLPSRLKTFCKHFCYREMTSPVSSLYRDTRPHN